MQNSEELEESLEVCASEDFFLFGGVVGKISAEMTSLFLTDCYFFITF
jgi:hypothetical protein